MLSANIITRQPFIDEETTKRTTNGSFRKAHKRFLQRIEAYSTTTATPRKNTTDSTSSLPAMFHSFIGNCNANMESRQQEILETNETNYISPTIEMETTITTNATTNATTDANDRSIELERAYVHDVYENCDEPIGPVKPRISQFLAGLEPGSIVCDVGCGNGRYLNSCNPLIYTIGADRCYRLAQLAHEKGGEVALCDNLELPFKDESFDAVLSLAVVHHFATTERRVGAIKELARILRIGGRVIISAWALEQKHRRFESQDVLIPWQSPKSSSFYYSDDEDDDDFLPPYHAYTEESTNSSRSIGDGDSSSLSSSSPGESCYSFVRRAIQKLASNRKHPWFLESWTSKETKTDSSLECEDVRDLPIELRHLEDFSEYIDPPLAAGLKSRSLGSILNPPPRQIVRSRSSVPSLGGQLPEIKSGQQTTTAFHMSTLLSEGVFLPAHQITKLDATALAMPIRRPKLVKQKQSLCDDDQHLPEISTQALYFLDKNSNTDDASRACLRKQSSLNEELMAESRLKEREKIRRKIQKQMSLNDTFLCRSMFSKRLQTMREGFATKLKTSTGSLERVTKNGIIKIMQNLKSGPLSGQPSSKSFKNNIDARHISKNLISRTNSIDNNSAKDITNEEEKTRRSSHESGSDSSKDSSLQSDTSVESEDSFASVIYVPKTEQNIIHHQLQRHHSNASCSINGTNCNNIKKYIICRSNSTPHKTPTMPLSPVLLPYLKGTINNPTLTTVTNTELEQLASPKHDSTNKTTIPRFNFDNDHIERQNNSEKLNTKESLTSIKSQKNIKITKEIIKDLPQIPKFGKQFLQTQNSMKNNFPIVRKTSASPTTSKLLTMEIFNPATDDLDSDSSEPSSPDSIDSVINALNPNENFSKKVKEDTKTGQSYEIRDCKIKNLPKNKDLLVNEKNNDDIVVSACSKNNKLANTNTDTTNTPSLASHGNQIKVYDFAEKLSAQLLKELDEANRIEEQSLKTINHSNNILSNSKNSSINKKINDESYLKKYNEDFCDITSLRDELRERRLLLANFTTNSSTASSSTSSLTRTKTEKHYNIIPDTKNLIADNDDEIYSSIEYDDDDVIFEEDENQGDDSNYYNSMNKKNTISFSQVTSSHKSQSSKKKLNSRLNMESWDHSNSSSTSLESPTQGGGSTTHHRYFHVFREGELDALINHNVSSLHIVSSYYERASWCVVAEKVQVWTI